MIKRSSHLNITVNVKETTSQSLWPVFLLYCCQELSKHPVCKSSSRQNISLYLFQPFPFSFLLPLHTGNINFPPKNSFFTISLFSPSKICSSFSVVAIIFSSLLPQTLRPFALSIRPLPPSFCPIWPVRG